MTFGTATIANEAAEDVPLTPMQAAVNSRAFRAQHDLIGYGHIFVVMKFVAWANDQPEFPWPEQVQFRFGVSRATSHRWLNALADAYEFERPRRNGNGEIRRDEP